MGYRDGSDYKKISVNGMEYEEIARKADQTTYAIISGINYKLIDATHIENNSNHPIKVSLIPFDEDFVSGFTLYPTETKMLAGTVYVKQESRMKIEARLEIG